MKKVFVAIAVAAICVGAVEAQESASEGARSYTAPDDSYTVPVPSGWSIDERDRGVRISGPGGEIELIVMVLPAGDSLEGAVQRAWESVRPGFDLEIQQQAEPPAGAGIDKRVVMAYRAEGRAVQVDAKLIGDRAYVLLIDGPLAAVQRRGAQVNTIASGLQISGVQETDLSGRSAQAIDDSLIARLERYVPRVLELFGVPGASMAIVQDGEVVYTRGFGVTEKGGEEPITPETHMMIGSTGKSMTTTMMASMVAEGLFRWDTPVVEVMPEFQFSNPELTRSITMENMVCACSGVPRRDFELFFNAQELSPEAVVRSLAEFELFTDFGETFQYSNQMVAVGGYAAAAAAGASFGELQQSYRRELESRILAPLEMDRTTLSFEEVMARDQHASPHSLRFGLSYTPIPLEGERFVEPVAPAGGHWSTANDMARYMIMQLQNGVGPSGQRIVAGGPLLRTREGRVNVSAGTQYGLGWFVDRFKGIRMIHHGGNTVGFTSSFGFLPEKRLGVVILANAETANPALEQIRSFVFDNAFDDYDREQDERELDFAVRQLQQHPAMSGPDGLRDAVTPSEVRRYTGSYASEQLGEIELRLVDGELILDAGTYRSPLLPVERDGSVDHYVLAASPFRSVPVNFEELDGGYRIDLGSGATEYSFAPSE